MKESRPRKESSRGKMFLIGFLTGIIMTVMIVAGITGYFISYPQKILKKAVDLGMDRVIERTIHSIPKEYIEQHQQKITEHFQRFARAYTKDRVSSEDISILGRKIVTVIQEQRITTNEMDEILHLVKDCSE